MEFTQEIQDDITSLHAENLALQLGRVLINKDVRSKLAWMSAVCQKQREKGLEADIACQTDPQFVLIAGGGVHEPSVISTFGQ